MDNLEEFQKQEIRKARKETFFQALAALGGGVFGGVVSSVIVYLILR